LASIRKIKAGLVKPTDINSFIGEYGNIFFDVDTGDLRLSDGVTPGGIPLGGGGGGGGAVIFRQLLDTPNSYAGAANFFVKVNSTATALEFKEETLFDGDYNSLTNKPDLSVYQTIIGAFSGDYNDLYNKPALFSGSYDDLTNKPIIFSGDYNDLTNKPDLSLYQLKVDAFSGNYNDLVNLPDLSLYQLVSNAFSGSYTDLTDKPTLFSGSYTDLTDKPTLFSGSYTDLTDKPTPLSVGVIDLNNNLIKNYTTINSLRFDEESGFDIVDLGSGAVKIQMNSTFKTWKSAGEQDLVATGLDVVEFIAGTGIDISLNPSGSPYQTITITNTGGNGGSSNVTSLNDLDDVAYDSSVEVGDTLTWNGFQWVPDTDSTGGTGADLLGVIIDLDIDADGDLILTHVDTFTKENVEIDSLGYFILSDGV